MKAQKSVVSIAIAAAMFSGAAFANDVNTVVSIESNAQAYSAVGQVVNPKISIQDYIDAANREQVVNSANSQATASNSSRWATERAL